MGDVVIFKTWDDSEAELVRGLLSSYGIPCAVVSDITHAVYPLTLDGLGEIRLSVPEDMREEALRILAEHRKQVEEQDVGPEDESEEAGEE